MLDVLPQDPVLGVVLKCDKAALLGAAHLWGERISGHLLSIPSTSVFALATSHDSSGCGKLCLGSDPQRQDINPRWPPDQYHSERQADLANGTSYPLAAHVYPFRYTPYPPVCPAGHLGWPPYPFDLSKVIEPIGPAAQHVLPLRQLDHELPAAASPPRRGSARCLLDTAGSRVDISDDRVELGCLHQQSLEGTHMLVTLHRDTTCPSAQHRDGQGWSGTTGRCPGPSRTSADEPGSFR